MAWRAIKEAKELLRIESLRLKTGTGLPADELAPRPRLPASSKIYALTGSTMLRSP